VYSGAALRIKQVIEKQTLGRLLYLDAVRAHLGQIQSDVSVVWDLAIHEFALIDFLLGEMPSAVSATGAAFYGSLEEIADVTLYYSHGILAHVHVSWLAPARTRQLIIAGTEKMLLFDDTLTDNKLQLMDRGVDLSDNAGADEPSITYRDGVCTALSHANPEPLVAVIDEFVKSIEQNRDPLTDGMVGLRCVRILQAVERSLRLKGNCIAL
jgi:predicted dehydrogenase